MKYYMLDPADWNKLKPLIGDLGPVPDPQIAAAAVAEDDDGTLKGVWFLQLTFHLEPVIIAPRTMVNFLRLIETINEAIAIRIPDGQSTDYFIHAPNGKIASMAEVGGMERMPYTVYRRTISKNGKEV